MQTRKTPVINCVVVTYNRLELLKECIDALLRQDYPINRIIIIDNCSTDDTVEWLSTLSDDTRFHVVRTEKNIGGAGGFSLGLKISVESGCDYTWMMDDDTIPASDALRLLAKTLAPDGTTGWAASKVNWKDGTRHVMNRCAVEKVNGRLSGPMYADGTAFYLATFCTFVSVLIGSAAVRCVGLPIKEFFIWCDDIEYTSRIYNAGFTCVFVPESIVTHKSAENYYPTVDKAPSVMAPRFYYQARNTSYLKRRNSKCLLFFYLSMLNKFRLYRHKAGRRKDGCGKAFWEAAKKGCLDGLTFNPPIEHIGGTGGTPVRKPQKEEDL